VFFRDHASLGATRSVFTIHNLAFQGRFAAGRLPATGLPASEMHMEGIEFYGGINLMKAGIEYADAVTTVSPRYAEEIRSPEFGEGLDGLLRARAGSLHGILNGIDVEAWNPGADSHLPARYEVDAMEGKSVCKQALFEEMGLRLPIETPLVAMVTRMTRQKGSDLVLEASAGILGLGVGLVVLGSGDPDIEQGFRYLADWYGGRAAIRIGYDEALSHRIEAGADVFLMPSRYEPCGLNQMYSLRYGTVPVVRATGGLDDTVRDPRDARERANGFKFHSPAGGDMVAALGRAVEAYRNPQWWRELRRVGMSEDFSWGVSAARYEKLYESLG
jgi:starch synthase